LFPAVQSLQLRAAPFAWPAELGFKKPSFFGFLKHKTSKGQFRFLKFFLFLLCNLLNKPHIQVLIAICDNFINFIFIVHMVLFFAHWRFVRYGV